MNAKRAIKELERQLRHEPDNLVLRLRLAAVYREATRASESVALYRSVAVAYHAQGRLAQAIAVCRSVLEIEPTQPETLTLLAELDALRRARGQSESEAGSSQRRGSTGMPALGPDHGEPPPLPAPPPMPAPVTMPALPAIPTMAGLPAAARRLSSPPPAPGGRGSPGDLPRARTPSAPPPLPPPRPGLLPPEEATALARPASRPPLPRPIASSAAPLRPESRTAGANEFGHRSGMTPQKTDAFARPGSARPGSAGARPGSAGAARPGSIDRGPTADPRELSPKARAARSPDPAERLGIDPSSSATMREQLLVTADGAVTVADAASTQRMPVPPTRRRQRPSSSSGSEETPLPAPLALHDVAEDSLVVDGIRPGIRRDLRPLGSTSTDELPAIPLGRRSARAPSAGDDEAPTRLADDPATDVETAERVDDGPTRVNSGEVTMRRTGPAAWPVPTPITDVGATATTGRWSRGPAPRPTRPMSAVQIPGESEPRSEPRPEPRSEPRPVIRARRSRVDMPGFELVDLGQVSQPPALSSDGGPDAGFLTESTLVGDDRGSGDGGEVTDEHDRDRTEAPLERTKERARRRRRGGASSSSVNVLAPSGTPSSPPMVRPPTAAPGAASSRPGSASAPGLGSRPASAPGLGSRPASAPPHPSAPGPRPTASPASPALRPSPPALGRRPARVTKPMGSAAGDREALPSELLPYQRGHRLLDLGAEPTFADSSDEPDEMTDPRDPTASESATVIDDRGTDEMTRNDGEPQEDTHAGEAPEMTRADGDRGDDEAQEDTDVGSASRRIRQPRTSADALVLGQAFQRPFSETLAALGPDNSTIEAPLAIFAALPEDALATLGQQLVRRRVVPGDVLVREGDIGESCFVIATGEVRILKRDPVATDAEAVEIARLGAGSMFGEFALLADRRRHATVQATAVSEVYEIPRRMLRALASSYPEVGPILETFYRERLLSTLLTTAPFFRPLPEEQRAELLARFRPLRSDAGQQLVREGEHAGGFYLILLGSVEITKRVGKRPLLLANLGEGAYFGEMSLLRGGTACASVTSVGPSELAVLPPRDFYEVVAGNPLLWAEIQREVERRAEMNQIVTGHSAMV